VAFAPQVVWSVSESDGSFFAGVAPVNVPKLAVDRVSRTLIGVSVPPAGCLPVRRIELTMARCCAAALIWSPVFGVAAASATSPELAWAMTPAMLGAPLGDGSGLSRGVARGW
jgi:hypothetical protein